MSQPPIHPVPQPPSDTPEPEPRLLWEAPSLTRFGRVEEITQGISYLPLDGLFNLTP